MGFILSCFGDLRKYRAIKVVSWRCLFRQSSLADFSIYWRVIEIFAGSKRLKFTR